MDKDPDKHRIICDIHFQRTTSGIFVDHDLIFLIFGQWKLAYIPSIHNRVLLLIRVSYSELVRATVFWYSVTLIS